MSPFFFLVLGVLFFHHTSVCSFAKLLFHWPVSVAKRFTVHAPTTLFGRHQLACSLMLACVFDRGVYVNFNFADSDCCSIWICKGTLWWEISGLLFPQFLSTKNINTSVSPAFAHYILVTRSYPLPWVVLTISRALFIIVCMQMGDISLPDCFQTNFSLLKGWH